MIYDIMYSEDYCNHDDKLYTRSDIVLDDIVTSVGFVHSGDVASDDDRIRQRFSGHCIPHKTFDSDMTLYQSLKTS